MNFMKQQINRIKNPPKPKLEKDFNYNTFSVLVLMFFAMIGVVVFHLTKVSPEIIPEQYASIFGGTVLAAVLIGIIPFGNIEETVMPFIFYHLWKDSK